MKKKFSSDKSFGILLFSILLLSHLILYKLKFSLIIPISILILILSYFKPSIFRFPKELWIKFGFILGKIINPIICFILYFLVIGTTKIMLDLFNKKKNQKKSDGFIKSNWHIRKDESYSNFDDQF